MTTNPPPVRCPLHKRIQPCGLCADPRRIHRADCDAIPSADEPAYSHCICPVRPAVPSAEEIAREVANYTDCHLAIPAIMERLTRWQRQTALAAKVEVLEEVVEKLVTIDAFHDQDDCCRGSEAALDSARSMLAALRAEQEKEKGR